MNDKFRELAGIIAVIATSLTGFYQLMELTGVSGWLEANYGAPVKSLFWVLGFLATIGFVWRFLYHWEVIGAGGAAAGTGLRETYDVLRARLASHEDANDGYARRLKTFLAKVDRFFGDAESPRQRAVLLRDPAALWTAPAFDRCLLLALLYPVGVIFLVWAVSGEIGPAEQALALKTVDGWRRFLSIVAIAFTTFANFAMWRAWGTEQADRWRLLAVAISIASFFAIVFAVHSVVAAIIAVVITRAAAVAVPGAGALMVTMVVLLSGVGTFPSDGARAGVGVDVLVVLIIYFAVFRAVVNVTHKSISEGWQDKFLSVFLVIGLTTCLAEAMWLTSFSGWNTTGPLLLFLGLLTLVNAPFDWLSLGLTRLLLRWGIQLGGPSPYALALIDALLASFLIASLAAAMISAVDLFDHLAVAGGGEKARVLPPMQFYLAALRAVPQAPEFWWVYATLFSTMIPSVINLFIAGFSFQRGLPMLRRWLLGAMRENEAMPGIKLFSAALLLTAQDAVAAIFALLVPIILTWGVVWQVMPRLALGILGLAEKVAM